LRNHYNFILNIFIYIKLKNIKNQNMKIKKYKRKKQ
jgi:hypothetical protein